MHFYCQKIPVARNRNRRRGLIDPPGGLKNVKVREVEKLAIQCPVNLHAACSRCSRISWSTYHKRCNQSSHFGPLLSVAADSGSEMERDRESINRRRRWRCCRHCGRTDDTIPARLQLTRCLSVWRMDRSVYSGASCSSSG